MISTLPAALLAEPLLPAANRDLCGLGMNLTDFVSPVIVPTKA